jgi:hemolysin activation/secretion protein
MFYATYPHCRLIARTALLAAVSACVLLAGPAQAQQADFTLPGSADPSRTGVMQDPAPPKRESQGESVVVDQPAVTAPDGFEQVTLQLNEINLVGMTRYNRAEFAPVINRLKGQTITLAQIYDVVAAITEAYRRDGYVLTRVFLPPQEIDGGVVTIQIIEGYVADVRVSGNVPNSYLLRDTIAKIRGMRPLNIHALERYLLLLNDLPNTDVRGVFEPIDAEDPGAVALILDVAHDDDVAFTLGYNNYGSRYLGPHQGTASIAIPDVLIDYSLLTLGGLVSIPASETKSVQAGYMVPLNAEGTTLSTDMSANFTLPGYSLRELELDGVSKQVGLTVSHPLIRSRANNLYVTLGMVARNSETDVLTDRLYDDRIRSLSLGASYDFVDPFDGNSAIGANVVKGLDILGARKTGSEDLSREFGTSDFTKLTANLSRTQYLVGGYQIFAGAQGQYSYDPLLSSEEFGFGGNYMGRAYDNSEIIGEHGVGMVVEARYKTIVVADRAAIQPFVFYDFGKVWNTDPNDNTNMSAASAGVGTRFQLFDNISGEAQVAQPLTKPIDTPLYGSDDKPRFLFSLTTAF